jgi:phage recombination protein Bet
MADIDDALDKFLPSVNLNERDKIAFLQIARGFGLNPFKREIYAITYGNKTTIVTGYEVYLKRAERSGKLDGWSCDVTEDGKKATCVIHRKDWRKPLVHVVYVDEARQESPIWKKMPKFMLRKVAIGQAFRLAFPDELGGMPYLSEEVTDRRSEDIPEAEVVDKADEDSQALDKLQDKTSEKSDETLKRKEYEEAKTKIIDDICQFAIANSVDIKKITKGKGLGEFELNRLKNLLELLEKGKLK